ncbi:ricin-type beta-trefoil lectin protein [Jatrophihabitans sp. GAS493]|uniref:ricin-type beta-trefoil lectin domain protein n=1 Tax=Jatrophihabitans sp. GAS493 TaxID=1907575 RepID=UPI000BBFD871|nr:ricin-type beta-trefoil lectin protein [Jatrophihabitans sp. GAS493]
MRRRWSRLAILGGIDDWNLSQTAIRWSVVQNEGSGDRARHSHAWGGGSGHRADAARADGISTISVVTTGACIQADPDSNVYLAPCNGSNAQNWQFVTAANRPAFTLLVNTASGACLTTVGNTNEVESMTMDPCDDSPDITDLDFHQGWIPSSGVHFFSETDGFLTDNSQCGLIAVPRNDDSPLSGAATWNVPGVEVASDRLKQVLVDESGNVEPLLPLGQTQPPQ